MPDSCIETMRRLLFQRLEMLSVDARKVPFEKDSSLPKDPDEALIEIQRRAKESTNRLGITPIKGEDWEEYILE